MRRLVVRSGIVGLTLSASAFGQITFSEEGAARGLSGYTIAAGQCLGVAAADYDQDGDIDLLVPTGHNTPTRLYQNDGTGHFTDVTAAVGLSSLSNDRCGLMFDYDGDGDLDILLVNDHYGQSTGGPSITWPNTIRLFRQDAGMFTEVTASAGVGGLRLGSVGDPAPNAHVGGAVAGDLDGDGDLDVFVGFWFEKQVLLRNNGNGTFTDVSAGSGVASTPKLNWGSVIRDFNRDGRLDIFCSIDGAPNGLWLNQGGMHFTDAAAANGVNTAWNDMGIATCDFDNDGDLDMYVTEISDETLAHPVWGQRNNVLYEDRGAGASPRFVDVARICGVGFGQWGWGCDFGDFDLDGWADLAATNGYFNQGFEVDRSRLFLNLATTPASFLEIGQLAGFSDTSISSGLIAFDADRDGDLDLVQVHHPGGIRLFINNTARGSRHWLVVQPRRAGGGDWESIGATVTVEANGQTMTRLITCGTSILSQAPYEAHFGLGDATVVDRVLVKWPDGRQREVRGVKAVDTVLVLKPWPKGMGVSAE